METSKEHVLFFEFYYWLLRNKLDVFQKIKEKNPEEGWDYALKLTIDYFEKKGQQNKADYLKGLLKEEQQSFEINEEDFKSIGSISKKLIQ